MEQQEVAIVAWFAVVLVHCPAESRVEAVAGPWPHVEHVVEAEVQPARSQVSIALPYLQACS